MEFNKVLDERKGRENESRELTSFSDEEKVGILFNLFEELQEKQNPVKKFLSDYERDIEIDRARSEIFEIIYKIIDGIENLEVLNNVRGNNEETILHHIAIRKDLLGVVYYIEKKLKSFDLQNEECKLKWKSFVDCVDKNGRTPLHMAACSGNVSFARKLISYGCDINASDKVLRTPLHLAVYNGQKYMINLLLQENAEIDTKDKDGNDPIDLACCCKNGGIDHKEICKEYIESMKEFFLDFFDREDLIKDFLKKDFVNRAITHFHSPEEVENETLKQGRLLSDKQNKNAGACINEHVDIYSTSIESSDFSSSSICSPSPKRRNTNTFKAEIVENYFLV